MQLVALLLRVQHSVAVGEETRTMVSFDSYIQEHPHHCYMCREFIFPGTSIRSKFVFTCSHGKHVHAKCGAAFFESLPAGKQCLSERCNRIPVVNPSLTRMRRKKFYDLYRSYYTTTPGRCQGCGGQLLPRNIHLLRSRSFLARVCTCGHYYCRSCAHKTYDTCPSIYKLNLKDLSLRGAFDTNDTEQFERFLEWHTTVIIPLVAPAFRTVYRQTPGMQNQIMLPVQNLLTRQMARANVRRRYTNRGQDYASATDQIVTIERQHQAQIPHPECLICYHKIIGELYPPASTHYKELHIANENPTTHLQNIHLLCAEFAFSVNPECPFCRRQILMK